MGASEPLSPWARRYGVLFEDDLTLGEDGVRHSGYVTGHPRLDPKFYAETIPTDEFANSGIFDHPNDIHKFFHLEYKHLTHLRGIKTWHLGPLMQYVRFSDRGLLPGGHYKSRPYAEATPEVLADITHLLEDDMIQVDENNWFAFFRRDRWYDLFARNQVPSGKRWSIDQPKLWEKVRISIELADRMLKAMINDRNSALHTMLYGKVMTWSDADTPIPEPFPGAMVIMSYDLCKLYCDIQNVDCPIENPADVQTKDWEATLEKLLDHQTWGFTDDAAISGAHWPNQDGVITLSVSGIDSLSGGDLTLAECCLMQHQLTRTILHELMHSLGLCRVKQRFPPLNPNFPNEYGIEPFVDFDGVAELGYAFEQRAFGGVLSDFDKTQRHPIAPHHHSWPLAYQAPELSAYGYKYADHPTFGMLQTVSNSLVPALYTSKLLSRSFWEDANIPRKSDNFFHRNQLLLGTSQSIPNNPAPWQEITYDKEKVSRGEMEPGESEMIQSWQHWEAVWNGARQAWYPQALQIWLHSPWMQTPFLDLLSEFGAEFRKGNEIRCGQISNLLAKKVPWSTNADTYKAALMPSSHEWIAHSVGLLMMAATPIRRAPKLEAVMDAGLMIQLNPNARAPLLRPIVITPELSREIQTCNASELFDPINTGEQPILGFNHIDIITVLRNAIKVLAEAKVTVSKPWLFEILRVSHRLEELRKEMSKTDPAFHSGLWAPAWDFKLPDYDPSQLTTWNVELQEWI